MIVVTRTWQLRKSLRPLFGEVWFGARQLNSSCGDGPRTGRNTRSGAAVAEKWTVPFASALAAAGDVARSQSALGSQPGVVTGTPSHCSTKIFVLGWNPVATMSIGFGIPCASAGTANGFDDGVTIDGGASAWAGATAVVRGAASAASAAKRTILRMSFMVRERDERSETARLLFSLTFPGRNASNRE
jgi:hypothetical protein